MSGRTAREECVARLRGLGGVVQCYPVGPPCVPPEECLPVEFPGEPRAVLRRCLARDSRWVDSVRQAKHGSALDRGSLQARARPNPALGCGGTDMYFFIRQLEPSGSNKDKHGACPPRAAHSLSNSFSPLKDGVSSGASATQCFGCYLPGTTEQESRRETAGCRGSQAICKTVTALVLFAFRCSRGYRSQMRWPRCPPARRPRCGTTQSTDVSSISFTARTRRKNWEGYWLLVCRSVIHLDPG